MEARIGQLLEHARWVRGFARCLTHDEADADDLAQDAWVQALRNPPREGELKGWLGAVVRNTRRMTLRGERRRSNREEASMDPAARVESAAELAEEVELGRLLAEELLALEEPYRETLLLTFYRNLSSSEIGAQRGIPAATVRTHLKVGLERLRRRLDERYGDRATWKRALVPLVALPRLAAKGTVAVKLALAVGVMTIAGAGVVIRHESRAKVAPVAVVATSPTTSPPSALRAQLTTLEQQKPAYEALRRALAAHHSTSAPDEDAPLDQSYVVAAMKDAIPLFQECFEAALEDHPDLSGTVILTFTIEADPDLGGIVSSSHVDPDKSTIRVPEVVQCFEESIYGARFGKPPFTGQKTITYPFVLTARDERARSIEMKR